MPNRRSPASPMPRRAPRWIVRRHESHADDPRCRRSPRFRTRAAACRRRGACRRAAPNRAQHRPHRPDLRAYRRSARRSLEPLMARFAELGFDDAETHMIGANSGGIDTAAAYSGDHRRLAPRRHHARELRVRLDARRRAIRVPPPASGSTSPDGGADRGHRRTVSTACAASSASRPIRTAPAARDLLTLVPQALEDRAAPSAASPAAVPVPRDSHLCCPGLGGRQTTARSSTGRSDPSRRPSTWPTARRRAAARRDRGTRPAARADGC